MRFLALSILAFLRVVSVADSNKLRAADQVS